MRYEPTTRFAVGARSGIIIIAMDYLKFVLIPTECILLTIPTTTLSMKIILYQWIKVEIFVCLGFVFHNNL